MKRLARKEILNMNPYVPGKPVSEVKREYNLEKVIKLASNENPLGVSKVVEEAIKEGIKNLNIYPDGYVYDLRKKLSEKHGVELNKLIFGDGTDEILECLFKAFIYNNDEIIFGHPTFVEYYRNTALMGGKVVQVPLKEDFSFDLEAIKEAITEKTKMIIICNPNNPTGTIVTKEEVSKFIKDVPKNILVVFDEAYFEYANAAGDYPDSLDYQKQGYNNVITLRTFSKAYALAGLRIGYAIADLEIIDLLERVRLPFNVGTLSQIGALAALEDKSHFEKSIKLNEEGKSYLYKEFDELGFAYAKSYSNFIFVNIGIETQKAFKFLLKEGIIIRPMYETFIRVSIGTMDENRLFIEKLKKLIKGE